MRTQMIITASGEFRIARLITDARIQPIAVCASGEILVNEDGFYILPSDEDELVDRLRFLVRDDWEVNPAQRQAAHQLLFLVDPNDGNIVRTKYGTLANLNPGQEES